MRGFFEVGVYHPKHEVNIGTLWRTALQLGAAGVFTIGQRYSKQSSDTLKSTKHIPLRTYAGINDLKEHLPNSAPLIAIEMGGIPLTEFNHPERAVYLLGAEDHGLPASILSECHSIVSLQAVNTNSYNVSVAGSIVMYHRLFLR